MTNKKEKVIKKKKFVKKEKIIKKKKIVKKKIVKKEKVIKKKKIVRKKKKIVKKKKYGGQKNLLDKLLDELLKVARKGDRFLVFKINNVNYVFIGEEHDIHQDINYISIIDKFDKIKSLILLESPSLQDIEHNTYAFVKHYSRDKELNDSHIDQTIIYLSNQIKKKIYKFFSLKKENLKNFKNDKNNFRDDSKKYINHEIASIDDRHIIENPNYIAEDTEDEKNFKYFKSNYLFPQKEPWSSEKKIIYRIISDALKIKLIKLTEIKTKNPNIYPQILKNIENKINSHITLLNSALTVPNVFVSLEKIGHIFIDINIILNYIIDPKFDQKYVFAFLGNNHIPNIKEFIYPKISTDYIKYEKKNKKWEYVKN